MDANKNLRTTRARATRLSSTFAITAVAGIDRLVSVTIPATPVHCIVMFRATRDKVLRHLRHRRLGHVEQVRRQRCIDAAIVDQQNIHR